MTTPALHLVCSSCGAVNRVAQDKPLSSGKCGKCTAPLSSQEPRELTGDILTKMRGRDEGAFVLDVWAPWCGPCRMMAPDFAEASQALSDKVRFFKLNSDEHNAAAAALGVRGIPALFLFNNNKLVAQASGARPAPAIINWIRSELPDAN